MLGDKVADVRRTLSRLGQLGSLLIEDASPSWCKSAKVVRVVSSFRLNEWGRGSDISEAALGGVMERVERLSAFLANKHIPIFATTIGAAQLPALGLSQLGLCNFQRYLGWREKENQLENRFVEVYRASDKAPFLAPASRVFLRSGIGLTDHSCSTGLASHFSSSEAIERAIVECLERHFHHLATFNAVRLRTISISRVKSDALSRILDELLANGFSVRVFYSGDLLPLHSIVAFLTHPSDDSKINRHSRYHCSVHWNPEEAIERAITEMLVGRAAGRHVGSGLVRAEPQIAETAEGEVDLCELATEEEIDRTSTAIDVAKRNGSEVYLCDLQHPEIGIPVFRALTPGLQPNFDLLGLDPLDFRSRVTEHLDIYPDVVADVGRGIFSQQDVILNPSKTERSRLPSTNKQLPHVFVGYEGEKRKLCAPPASEFEEMIEKRESRRRVSASIALEDLSRLLIRGVGSRKLAFAPDWGFHTKRAYPSAGARHSLELFLEIARVRDLPSGIYHYSIAEGVLMRLSASIDTRWSNRTVPRPAALIHVFSCASRTRVKYPLSVERFAYLEAGHLAQNLLLLCEELQINAVSLGAHLGNRVAAQISLPSDAFFVYAIALGGRTEAVGESEGEDG